MTEVERRPNEDEEGYLTTRAAGGHLLHVLPPSWRKDGNGTEALCGHRLTHKAGRQMARRSAWYHVSGGYSQLRKCPKCEAAYAAVVQARAPA